MLHNFRALFIEKKSQHKIEFTLQKYFNVAVTFTFGSVFRIENALTPTYGSVFRIYSKEMYRPFVHKLLMKLLMIHTKYSICETQTSLS
jgi:hypothetical protein